MIWTKSRRRSDVKVVWVTPASYPPSRQMTTNRSSSNGQINWVANEPGTIYYFMADQSTREQLLVGRKNYLPDRQRIERNRKAMANTWKCPAKNSLSLAADKNQTGPIVLSFSNWQDKRQRWRWRVQLCPNIDERDYQSFDGRVIYSCFTQ